MPRKMSDAALPLVVGMTICERVVRDEATGMASLIGVFDQVSGRRLPIRYDRLHIFVSLVGGHGKKGFSLSCRAPDGSAAFEAKGNALFKGLLGAADINIEITDLVFAAGGEYMIAFCCGGQPLASRPLLVTVKE